MKNLHLQAEVRRRIDASVLPSYFDSNETSFIALVEEDDNHRTVLLTNKGTVLCVSKSSAVEEDTTLALDHPSSYSSKTSSSNLIWHTNLNRCLDLAPENDPVEQSSLSAVSDWFSVTRLPSFLCCLSHQGAIVTVDPITGEAELVGEFANGIQAGCWSPDGQILVLVTNVEDDDDHVAGAPSKRSVLLTMNTQWEVLAEVNLDPEGAWIVPDTPVAVCFRPDSASSSQFLLAVSSVDVTSPTNQEGNLRKLRIFRGGSSTEHGLELHAMGRIEDGSGKLVPNFTADPKLPSALLAWAGADCSHVIASVVRKGKTTLQIAFLEPNGLRHREFNLRGLSPNATVLGLDFNNESDLLAVSLRDVDSDGNELDFVQLWHRSNYHWYLKREWRYQERIVKAAFSLHHAYSIHVLFTTHWRVYDVRWDASTVRTTSTTCTALVVDGCFLQSTFLHQAIIPPPMFAASLELPQPVCEVALSREDETSSLIGVAQLADASLAVLGCGDDGGDGEHKADGHAIHLQALAKWRADEKYPVDPITLREYVIVGNTSECVRLIAVASSDWDREDEIVVEISLILRKGNDGLLQTEIAVTNQFSVDGKVMNISPWSDSKYGALVQLENGQLREYAWDGINSTQMCNLLPSEAESLLEPCPWIEALCNVSKYDDNDDSAHTKRTRLVIGMSARGRLYCHDLLLADSVSSFSLSTQNECLCYVSAGSRCHVRFLSISQLHNFDPLMGSDENELLRGYEPRNVERGARLVALVPTQPQAVLQMPRGNLELVYPRALVIRSSVMLVSSGKYREAFEMMRRQKVDLNLIVDLDPKKFLREESGSVETFLDQVENMDHLNLFISSLQNTDCTQTRCPIPTWFRPQTEVTTDDAPFDFTDKVNRTCQALRAIMMNAEKAGQTPAGRAVTDGHFLLPILSTFAKEEPPKLEEALELVKTNAVSKHAVSSNKPPLFSDAAQKSIQYLAFLAEYELLFETALGMYDFDLARAVARHSQMDPKVYLPLLKRYKSLPQYYAKYEVDLRLKRYESALRNLHKSGCNESIEQNPAEQVELQPGFNSFERCLKLIEEHHLYRTALDLFHKDEEQTRIMLSLGHYFMEQKQASAALSIFAAVQPLDFARAKAAARACREWRTLFSLLSRDSSDSMEAKETKKLLLAREVADELAADARGHFDRRLKLADAARVLLDYGDDLAGAVDMLLSAEMWSEGHRLALMAETSAAPQTTVRLPHGQELAQKCIDSAISYAETAIMDLEERGETFCSANIRYAEVLKMRKQAIASGEEQLDEAPENDDNASLFSAASNASDLSYASYTSTGSTSTVSSVISVKSTTSFSLSGADVDNLHKSKFNTLGRDRRKEKRNSKKKGGKGRTKALPGSAKELQGLVQTLRSSCVDDNYRDSISDTITYLMRNGKISVARQLYDAFQSARSIIAQSQSFRQEQVDRETLAAESQARREGRSSQSPIVLTVEKEVDELRWSTLPESLHQLFDFLPTSL